MRTFFVAFILLPSVAGAGFFDGNKMLENCHEDGFISVGFAAGVLDALQVDNQTEWQVCPHQGVTARQARDVMCKYIEDNPASRHRSAGVLAWEGFHYAWPCSQ